MMVLLVVDLVVVVVICTLSVHGLSVLGSAASFAGSFGRLPHQGNAVPPGRHYSVQSASDPKHENQGSVPPPSKLSHTAFSMYKTPSSKAAHSHTSIRPPSIAIPPSLAHSPSSVRMHRSNDEGDQFITPKPSVSIPPYAHSHISPLSSPSSMSTGSVPPALAPMNPAADHFNMHVYSPANSPSGSFLKKMKSPPPKIFALPPPPPNLDCGCVWPIQVELGLDVAIYSFFTLVTELAEEIAASVGLNHSQVRIMGANADNNQQLEKSTVLINLVPRRVRFDYAAALSIYNKFWNKQVLIKDSVFGAYEVLNVHYPGLPPSPPSPTSISTIDDGPYSGRNHGGMMVKPLGVNVPRRKKDEIGGGIIATLIISSLAALVICLAVVWFLAWKNRNCITHKPQESSNHATFPPSPKKPLGTGGVKVLGTMSSSSAYTGSAKTFTLSEIQRATNTFNASRILGEGGFGLVYCGKLENGKEVAVKVLKRDDQHGSREFLAEVEMLSRLHHRNLVKLIGICSEGHTRCLVYELVPNGSLELHLHGADKGSDPLNWDARMKIALGAARGLAYLHEDSSPCVIHRDFKASNILLERDFTPKVSDFGLARTAIDEGNKHISTRVMGTFGYLAPEYAMTGHLLVKSDVYSYGVVLLELLTGRKPVDLTQPPGQENLVAYARPLLTSGEGLEAIVDPAITKSGSVSFDTIAKVAAIASMCVQPEVSHRPFMGEVVQALKLVCNEFDEAAATEVQQLKQAPNHESFLMEVVEMKNKGGLSSELMDVVQSQRRPPLPLSSTSGDLLCSSAGIEKGVHSGVLKRQCSSGPLVTGKNRQFLQRFRGSRSEHGFIPVKLWPRN